MIRRDFFRRALGAALAPVAARLAPAKAAAPEIVGVPVVTRHLPGYLVMPKGGYTVPPEFARVLMSVRSSRIMTLPMTSRVVRVPTGPASLADVWRERLPGVPFPGEPARDPLDEPADAGTAATRPPGPLGGGPVLHGPGRLVS